MRKFTVNRRKKTILQALISLSFLGLPFDMRVQFLALSGLFFFFLHSTSAQLDNTAFINRDTLQPGNIHKLGLTVHTFNFFKNNEYFNDIVSGYTLFGYQLNPELTYQPSKNFKLRAGVFVWKDFGTAGFTRVAPTFNVQFKADSLSIIFGTLEGALNHQLIEPLFDFERVINNRLENGLQFLYNKKRWRADLWVDWLRMIYQTSAFQEEISVGLSTTYRLVNKEKYWIEIPLQIQMFHRGGQIGTYSNRLTNWFNGTIGLSSQYTISPSSHIRSFRMEGYAVMFQDFSSRKVNIFKYGSGLYYNLTLKTKWLDLMASYWLANRFRSWQGGNLYQSVAVFPPRLETPDPFAKPIKQSPRVVNKPGDSTQIPYRETDRELLILRLMRDFRIMKGLVLTLRIEPVYNLPNRTFEFSHGFYITYRQNFLLKKISPIESD